MRALALLVVLLASRAAAAFCGFYVAGGDQKMFNDATQVVLMHQGTRTVLSMQNDYKGPPQDFALVIPVPVVLHEGDVKTLPADVFAKVDQMGAPRLVEYWEQDPCWVPPPYVPEPPGQVYAGATAVVDAAAPVDLGVKVEARFAVGEYNIVILSAKDSTGLASWLAQENYKIPAGAEPLRPYVEGNMKFFVAKVDPQKVKFVDGRAALSPLRFHYDSDEFALPIRLGLANSAGKQDLIVSILAPHQRYVTRNYRTITIPTNLDVAPAMKDKFAAFYTALYDRTVEKNPGAVVTEYAWEATTCDPCPGPALDQRDFLTLGADVLGGTKDKPEAYVAGDFVLTRLHARYGKEITDDLRFAEASPIVGGREHTIADGKLEQGAQADATNNFQGRYAIRHAWTGPITCSQPVRDRWGGPWTPQPDDLPARSATGLGLAPRGEVALASAVIHDIPEIDVKAGNPVAAVPGTVTSTVLGKSKSGCGCQTGGSGGLVVIGATAWLLRRRKR